jgi:hypothetical protein
MKALRQHHETHRFQVVHPLDDLPEVKCASEGLGPMALRGSARVALWALRGYLLLMSLLVVYHLLDMAGFIGRHAG